MREETAVRDEDRLPQMLETGQEGRPPAAQDDQEEATMSTFTEVSPLEGIDLEGSLPCEVVVDPFGRTCGSPGEIRIISSCCSCRGSVSSFFCTPCWSYLRLFIASQEWACAFCGMSREIRES